MISDLGGPHFFCLAMWKEEVMLEEDPDRKTTVRLSDMLFCFVFLKKKKNQDSVKMICGPQL